MLSVGIPREIKPFEKRVGLTPKDVGIITNHGINVFVESQAGSLSGFDDNAYKQYGAMIVWDQKGLYQKSQLIKKIKEPLDSEFALLKDKILFSFLHLASPECCDLVRALQANYVTAIGYETVEVEGRNILLAPMSEIAGGLAAIYGGLLLKDRQLGFVENDPNLTEKLQISASIYPKTPKDMRIGRVVIFGGGVAGEKAMELALQMEGEVTLVEKDARRRQFLIEKWENDTDSLCVLGCEDDISHVIQEADVMIGCVHRSGHRADQLFASEYLREVSLKRKKVILDVAVDQGGNFPETRATTYNRPVYVDSYGNLRFAVANMPSFCGKAASELMSSKTLEYTLAMAKNLEKTLLVFPELKRALNVQDGEVLHPAIRIAHKLDEGI